MCVGCVTNPIDLLNTYSNLIIAIFTIATVVIAIVQIWQIFLRGPDIRLHFPDETIVYQGPASLGSATIPNAPSMALFFALSLVFMNRGPRVGAITKVRLALLNPDPRVKVRRKTGEEDAYLLSFRFETEEGVNAPLSEVVTIEGNSARGIAKVRCAILRTNISPGNVQPPAADLIQGPIKIKVTYLEAQKDGLVQRDIEHEFKTLQPAVYDKSYVDSTREFLRL